MMELKQNLLMLLPEFISGAEDEPGAGNVNPPAGNQGDPGNNEGDNNPDNDENGSDTDPDPGEDGRTKALKAERKIRKDAEAEARRLKAENDTLKRASMDELDRTKAERDEATAKVTENETKLEKLVAGYRNNALTMAISAEATKLGFVDLDDALMGVDRDSISIEQDEDDPSQVTIDTKTVTSAVKKLATAKPHFIKTGTSNGDPTGSQFGGSRKSGGNKADEEEALRAKYPSL